MRRNGFTLVELVVVVLIVTALLAILIPILRERERQRLQAIADAEPWEVFEFRAEPARETFVEGDEIVIQCEIVNATGSPLDIPIYLDAFYLVFEGKSELVASTHYNDRYHHKTAVGPGESVRFDVPFSPIGTGVGRFQVVYGDNQIQDYQAPLRTTRIKGTLNSAGSLFSNRKYFESTAFQLVVLEAEDK